MDIKEKNKISFDFDNTLNLEWVIENLYKPLSEIYDIIIVTSRDSDKPNSYLWEVCEELNIDKDKIYFTNGKLKGEMLDKLKCVMHFDDDFVEICNINENHRCKGIMINYKMI